MKFSGLISREIDQFSNTRSLRNHSLTRMNESMTMQRSHCLQHLIPIELCCFNGHLLLFGRSLQRQHEAKVFACFHHDFARFRFRVELVIVNTDDVRVSCLQFRQIADLFEEHLRMFIATNRIDILNHFDGDRLASSTIICCVDATVQTFT